MQSLFMLFLLVSTINVFSAENTEIKNTDLDSASITLERGPCFGACPEYKVSIRGNGDVEFLGSNGLKQSEAHSAQIYAHEATELIEFALFKVRFDTLQERYGGNIDFPERITTLSVGGKTKTVSNFGDGPQILADLELMIDEVAATSKWLEK